MWTHFEGSVTDDTGVGGFWYWESFQKCSHQIQNQHLINNSDLSLFFLVVSFYSFWFVLACPFVFYYFKYLISLIYKTTLQFLMFPLPPNSFMCFTVYLWILYYKFFCKAHWACFYIWNLLLLFFISNHIVHLWRSLQPLLYCCPVAEVHFNCGFTSIYILSIFTGMIIVISSTHWQTSDTCSIISIITSYCITSLTKP